MGDGKGEAGATRADWEGGYAHICAYKGECDWTGGNTWQGCRVRWECLSGRCEE